MTYWRDFLRVTLLIALALVALNFAVRNFDRLDYSPPLPELFPSGSEHECPDASTVRTEPIPDPAFSARW